MKTIQTLVLLALISIVNSNLFAQSTLANIPGRNTISLNGRWYYIVDPVDAGIGNWIALWKDKVPTGKTDFYEYSFDNCPSINVPADYNSQVPKLEYYEGAVWYKKEFTYHKKNNTKLFLHFGGINYKAQIFLNGKKIGSHEGGFTPFQIDLTHLIKDGNNALLVYTNNKREKDAIPSLSYDWWNYGGITRDVTLVETPKSYIADYFIQLKKGSQSEVSGWLKIEGEKLKQNVTVVIPEAGINYKTTTNDSGFVAINFRSKFELWSPENPKLYNVSVLSETDTISEHIGFRTIDVNGTEIRLNGKPVFLKGVNIHEEIPQREGRAHSEADARMLLEWAKELGCNFVRLAHYPHNENIVRLADQMGLMVWSEIPVFQGVNFSSAKTNNKIIHMVNEMINRDRNRCGIVIWSVANETSPGKSRNNALIDAINECRKLDKTRLVTAAMNNVKYRKGAVDITDSLCNALDVISVNEYLGWYKAWTEKPEQTVWHSEFNKPLIISEFGGEALYGNHGPADVASSWSEEFQENIYIDQIKMFKSIPFLSGTCAWILADFKSPKRMHQTYQNGWNRKGLISDQGYKKKAWYILEKYYRE